MPKRNRMSAPPMPAKLKHYTRDAAEDTQQAIDSLLSHARKTAKRTLKHPMDDYYCCYIDTAVHLKICKLCASPGYDLDYKMVPHKDESGMCEYCGRVPFQPAIAIPLT